MDFEIKSKKPIQFEFGSNFKGVQTFEEKFHKFTKNLSWHDLQGDEIRWPHMYSKIWSSFTSGKYD
jgi:hypothetical protein